MQEPEERDELEEALAASWDVDTLAVYADYLQAEGDPRGELIALDLEIAAHGNNVELSKRRTSLLYAWLGGLVPVDNVHASWVGDSMKFGFVEDLVVDGNDPNAVARLEQVLASPAGPYVRGLTMKGRRAELEPALRAIATREHPWLVRMTIGFTMQDAPMEQDVAAVVFASMPRLDALELTPYPAFAGVAHPTIQRLSIRGASVYAALGATTFPAVTDLDLDLTNTATQWDYDEEYNVELPEPEALPAIEFPALRRLDLSRNIATLESAYEFLRTLDARAHVTHLEIAQLRSAADREDLIAAINGMDALEVIEIAHGHYYDPPDIPNVRFVRPEKWPWPTQDEAQGRALRIYQPNMKFGDTVTLFDAVELMERSYETLPAPARAAWSELWKFVAALQKQLGQFAARTLCEAVEACPELMQNGWRELREELSARRPFAPDAMVKIERCKG